MLSVNEKATWSYAVMWVKLWNFGKVYNQLFFAVEGVSLQARRLRAR